MALVGYVGIGSCRTRLTLVTPDSSALHEQATPPRVERAKHRSYRYPEEEGHSLVLDRYLRCLWDSFNLHLVEHVILLVDVTDPIEYVEHVLRWMSAAARRGTSVSSLSTPLYAAALHGVGSEGIVVDIGHTFTRLVPILYRTEVRELLCCAPGIGAGMPKPETASAGPGTPSSWTPGLARLLDVYLAMRIQLDDAGDENGVVSAMRSEAAAVTAASSPADCRFIESFAAGVEDAMSSLMDGAQRKGMPQVLQSWVLVGGGADIPSIRNFVGYLVSTRCPEAIKQQTKWKIYGIAVSKIDVDGLLLFSFLLLLSSAFFYYIYIFYSLVGAVMSHLESVHGVYRDPSLKEEAVLLLQKIRANSITRDVEGVHLVKNGLPAVRSEEIEEILEQRKAARENERIQRIEDDLHRRQAEYSSTLSAARTDDQRVEHTYQDATPLADVDGRAVLLNPLKTLFRITLIRCRVQERLSKIRDNAFVGERKKTQASVQVHRLQGLHCLAKLPQCSTEEEELSLPDYSETFKNTGRISVFHNFDAFEKHVFREPFRFKTKNYTAVRFPEFSLDLTAEAAEEVDMFHPETTGIQDVPTLRHFTQPVVTLERFKMPPHAYHFLPASRYGDFEKTGNDLLSQKSAASGGKKTTEPITECAAPSAIQLSVGLSSLPPKFAAGRAEDSLSDSDSDDGTLEHGYQPDLGWVPRSSKNGKSATTQRQKTSKNCNSAAFTHFIEKYT
eukprot:gene9149-6430_t